MPTKIGATIATKPNTQRIALHSAAAAGVSIGVAHYALGDSMASLLEWADKALYRAKA